MLINKGIIDDNSMGDSGCYGLYEPALGLVSLADYQLQVFKRAYSGEVCNRGLWHYSRHPNYFFEWLTCVRFPYSHYPIPMVIVRLYHH